MDNENSSSDSDSVVDETDEGHLERNKRSVGGTEWCGTSDSSPPPRAHVEWPPTEGQTVDLRSSFFGNTNYGNPDFGQRMQLFSRTSYFLAAYPDGTVRGTQDNNDLHTCSNKLTKQIKPGEPLRALMDGRRSKGSKERCGMMINGLRGYWDFSGTWRGGWLIPSARDLLAREDTLFEILNAGHVGHVKIVSLSLDKYVAMNANGRLYVQDDSNNEETVFIEKLHNGYNVYLCKAYQDENWWIGINKLGNGKRGRKTHISQKSVQFLPVRRKFQ